MEALALDLKLADLARRQHGVLHRRQARRLGFTDEMIRSRLATGRWIRLGHGVYALPGNPFTWHRQLMAATLAIPGAVVSGRAAAALHRFPGFRPGRPEITVPTGSTARSHLAVVRQSNAVDKTVVNGIPVVTVAQAIIDVAGVVDEERLGRLIDGLVAANPRRLEAIHDRYVAVARSRRPGIGRLRAVLDVRGDGYVPPHSELEAVLERVLDRVPGLPHRERQAGLPWRPAGGGRVDVLIPEWHAIVEADGRRWHTRVDDFEVDRQRDNDAIVNGYRPLRFTWHELTRRPREVVATVARLGEVIAAESRGTPAVVGRIEWTPPAGVPGKPPRGRRRAPDLIATLG